METSNTIIRIHSNDNVAVALRSLNAGTQVMIDNREIVLLDAIPTGHKFAITAIEPRAPVMKYGFPIGHATQTIETGQWVHVHNVKTNLSDILNYRYEPDFEPISIDDRGLTFEGYKRGDGEVGIRNEIWIIPASACVNDIGKAFAQHITTRGLPDTINGAYAWPHPYGCSQLGDDLGCTQTVLADLVHHPNAGGVLVLSLGCENNTMELFRDCTGAYNPERVKFLVCQEVEDEFEAGVRLLDELIRYAGQAKRETVSIQHLRVGLECGGSDGLSGITANPLVGVFSDTLVALGGTTVLTEVPEMFGAETILMNRCENETVFRRCVSMINDYKQYFMNHGQPIYENPSPGNKDGGLTTLEEKSLGCIQKGGTCPVSDVLKYGERIKKRGLNLLSGPGNDPVSVTALTAAGCHLILFTTGRGTPYGGPVPTIKIATNTDLARHKQRWIDLDAGALLHGKTMANCANDLLQLVLDAASGLKKTRNEELGFREIAILKDGVTV